MLFDYNIPIKWRTLIALLLISLLLPLIVSIYSFSAATVDNNSLRNKILVILKKSKTECEKKPKYMFYSYISKTYSNSTNGGKKYLKDLKSSGIKDIKEDPQLEAYENHLANQIVDLSDVALWKFSLFNFALKCNAFLLALSGIAALVIVLIKLIF